MSDHGNTRERRDTLGGEPENITDKSLPHTDHLTALERHLDEHASAPPAKVIIKDFKSRPGTPGTPEWEAARERGE